MTESTNSPLQLQGEEEEELIAHFVIVLPVVPSRIALSLRRREISVPVSLLYNATHNQMQRNWVKDVFLPEWIQVFEQVLPEADLDHFRREFDSRSDPMFLFAPMSSNNRFRFKKTNWFRDQMAKAVSENRNDIHFVMEPRGGLLVAINRLLVGVSNEPAASVRSGDSLATDSFFKGSTGNSVCTVDSHGETIGPPAEAEIQVPALPVIAPCIPDDQLQRPNPGYVAAPDPKSHIDDLDEFHTNVGSVRSVLSRSMLRAGSRIGDMFRRSSSFSSHDATAHVHMSPPPGDVPDLDVEEEAEDFFVGQAPIQGSAQDTGVHKNSQGHSCKNPTAQGHAHIPLDLTGLPKSFRPVPTIENIPQKPVSSKKAASVPGNIAWDQFDCGDEDLYRARSPAVVANERINMEPTRGPDWRKFSFDPLDIKISADTGTIVPWYAPHP